MFGTQRNRAQMYAQVGVDSLVATADPHQLILMLYDGALQAIAQASVSIQQLNIPAKSKAIDQAIRIILDGLYAALDIKAGGELAVRLASLYEYMIERLTYANSTNSLPTLEEVSKLLMTLREAWAEIPKNLNANKEG